MAKRLMLFWLAGGLPLLGLVIWTRLPAGSSSFDQHSPAVVGTDGAVSVGAVTLWNEYEENAVAADARYRKKPVRVAGTVLGVDREGRDKIVIDLASGNLIFRTNANLEPSQAQVAATLKKGQPVVLRCLGGERLFKMPQLEGCRIESASGA
jgi:hypothetical protein